MIEKGYDGAEAKEMLRQLELIFVQWHIQWRRMMDALALRE